MKAARVALAAILVAGIITVVPSSPANAAASVCSTVGHIGAGNDQLTVVDTLDPSPATNETIQGTIGTLSIFGTTSALATKTLYGIEDDQLGTIDLETAAFTPATSTTGSGNGDLGVQPLNNAYDITFTTGGTMLGVSIRAGDDLLFEIDPTTGAAVPNAFGVGQDYEVVDTTTGFPGGTDLKEIAVDPVSSKIYGIAREPDGTSHLVTVDLIYGDPDVTHLTVIGSSMVDIYGFAFDESGTAWALRRDGLLYQVDTATGIGTIITTIDDMSEYTSLNCGPIVPVANQAPVFDQDLLDRSDPETTVISLSAAASDPDGDPLLYSATGLPSGLSIHPSSGLISGTIDITAETSSPYATEITVDDGTVTATDTFTWTVTSAGTLYLIANSGGANGGDDLLTAVDPGDFNALTNEVSVGTGTGTWDIYGAAIQPSTGTLFAVNADRLGTVDIATGVFTAMPSLFGSGNGSLGAVTFNDVTGAEFDPGTGDLYAVHDHDSGSVLFEVDPATGAAKPGAFSGADYILIQPLSPLLEYSADIAFDPVSGLLHTVMTNGADGWKLGTVDPATGSTIEIGDTATLLRGLAFDPTGQLWGVTANGGAEFLYEISTTDGAATNPRPIDNGGNYESIAYRITNTNSNPIFNQDLTDRGDAENDPISLSAAATDPDGDGLLYTATGLPDGLTINP
ncbi:MAG: putative Ig domain-containing protein, partial [Acidimicrobiia bacterium]|nr:putative Ig domain-containing protein [Acidimicrobiia bacterium]